jgi:hypothetical protein
MQHLRFSQNFFSTGASLPQSTEISTYPQEIHKLIQWLTPKKMT